jgi:fructose-1,6-bisphosphatase/inositol monophosphatase family enzyme
MKTVSQKSALITAIQGRPRRRPGHARQLARPKRVNWPIAHDIKLELDVRCQKLIEKILRAAFPQIPLLGEEGCIPAT